jgi:hypothetical protein
MDQEPGETYNATLVLTLVTGQMVTLDATHTRVGTQWLSDAGGLESLERILGSVTNGGNQPGTRCIVEVDDTGRPVRFFPAHAVVIARIDLYPLEQ